MAEQREHQNWHRTASHGTSSFRRSAKATTIEERLTGQVRKVQQITENEKERCSELSAFVTLEFHDEIRRETYSATLRMVQFYIAVDKWVRLAQAEASRQELKALPPKRGKATSRICIAP
ncbi:hypothetical protein T10_2937 [Trichinella papuae]|uniref:Uncharacterized protein n=1 Tax=Trichinella papuae TaxID=268474 RepID=A0A0V1M209_9BILA|nr:hypothetical protein T10_2937 [Trichinella papuae]